MPKGKKFDAAEKHFLGKQATYEKEIRRLKAICEEQHQELLRVLTENKCLRDENESLVGRNDRLLSYSGLSQADIRAACEKDKKIGELFSMLGYNRQIFL